MANKYVAVIGAARASKRAHGEWSCFVGANKGALIKQALHQAQVWGADYEVWVGTLTSQAITPVDYVLVKL